MNEKIEKIHYSSPIGLIEITGTSKEILSLYFVDKSNAGAATNSKELNSCVKQLDEYFAGKRKDFDLNVKLNGTQFQSNVWKALKKIPFGQTKSYQDIAKSIDNIKAVRAVGNANNRNKISIVVPCHRVVGKNGSLVGYAGGLERKQWLLNHEKNL